MVVSRGRNCPSPEGYAWGWFDCVAFLIQRGLGVVSGVSGGNSLSYVSSVNVCVYSAYYVYIDVKKTLHTGFVFCDMHCWFCK